MSSTIVPSWMFDACPQLTFLDGYDLRGGLRSYAFPGSMAPFRSQALLFDVHYDGFFFAPLRYEHSLTLQLRVSNDNRLGYASLSEDLREWTQQNLYVMFYQILECDLKKGKNSNASVHKVVHSGKGKVDKGKRIMMEDTNVVPNKKADRRNNVVVMVRGGGRVCGDDDDVVGEGRVVEVIITAAEPRWGGRSDFNAHQVSQASNSPEKNMLKGVNINHEASGRLNDLEIIQDEDMHPFLDTSLNHEEDDQEIDEPQRDLGEPANYKAVLLDPESNKWLNAMNVEMQSMKDNKVWKLVVLPPN
nr:hypothetical protein [Tanacetum cinerariifolium]